MCTCVDFTQCKLFSGTINPLSVVHFVCRVIDGFDTLDAMERVPVGKKNRPLADIKIESVTIHSNPLAVN